MLITNILIICVLWNVNNYLVHNRINNILIKKSIYLIKYLKYIIYIFLTFYPIIFFAQDLKFKPTISILGSQSFIKNYAHINSGVFIIEDRKVNYGLEITQKSYLQFNTFIRLGLRFQHFKTNVYGVNQVEELYSYPYPFSWESRYTSFTIPIHLGKDYEINKIKRGDYYFGL